VIQLIGLKGIPILKKGDDLVVIILAAMEQMGLEIEKGDIFVIAETVISRIEGRVRTLSEIIPTQEAIKIATELQKDPRLVTLILQESKKILKMAVINGIGKIIVETNQGYICADAGIDSSNSPRGMVTLLPIEPDRSATRLREQIYNLTKKDVAIIISDTHGRPFRRGAINIALGVSGIEEIHDYRGIPDLFGYTLQKTQVAIADELASAAELIMGEANEGIPIVLIRGYKYNNKDGKGIRLLRPPEEDLFR